MNCNDKCARGRVVSQSPITSSTLKRYAGKWIALRGRKVVASAPTYEQLRDGPGIRPTDAVYRVPPAGVQRFVGFRERPGW